MATAASAAVFDGLEMGMDLVKQLRGSENDKNKALKYLRTAISRRRRELASLVLNLRNNKYTLGELQKMADQSFKFIKMATKLSDAMQRVDPADESLPLFDQLLKKLVAEYHAIRDHLMQVVSNKGALDKNIVDLAGQMGSYKKPANRRAKSTAQPQTGQAKAPNIQKINLSRTDPSSLARNGLKDLPREAIKALNGASTTARGANSAQQGFTTSFNRAGVLIVTNNGAVAPTATAATANSNRVLAQINTQNRESSLFWNKFEEKIDIHFDDLKKILRSGTANHGGGGAGLLGTAAGILGDLFTSKLKNSKALRMFSRSFYTEAYKELKSAARDVLSRVSSKAGGIVDDQIAKITAFKSFIGKQLESLNSVIKSQWNNAAKLVDDGVEGLVDSLVKGGKYLGTSILDFGEAMGGKLQSVTSTITKWSAQTIAGLADFSGSLGKTFSSIATSLEGHISSITSLASKGIDAVKLAAGTIGDDLAGAFKGATKAGGGLMDFLGDIGGKGLKFLGGASKFLPFVGDAVSGYQSYQESGSILRGVAAGVGSFGGRVAGTAAGALTAPVTGPVGAIAGDIGGGIAGANAGNALYDRIMGSSRTKDDNVPKTVNPNPVVNAPPATPPVAATALPSMGGAFSTAEDYEKAGYPVPGYLKKKRSGTPSALFHNSSYEGASSLNSDAANMLAPQAAKADGAALVRLTDDTIGNIAVALARVLKGRGAGGGSSEGGIIQASYSTGGSGSSFGAGNNSVLGGGGFGGGSGSSSGMGGGSGGGTGGNSAGGSYIAPGGLRKGHGVVHNGGSGGGQSVGGADSGGMSGSAIDQNMELLRKKESFRSTPYMDVNHLRLGYGSDTITHPDGSVSEVKAGDTVTKEDAERDLKRRVTQSQQQARKAIGAAAWDKLNPGAKAAIGSITYNYGHTPSRIVGAAQSGDHEALAHSVEGLAGDNGGVNASRRRDEANIIRNSKPEAPGALGGTADKANAAMSPAGPSSVVETQGKVAGIRKLPIQDKLKDQLDFAAQKNGVQAEIYSGGQPSEGPNRTGSHRHDNGGAGDLKLFTRDDKGNKHYLSMNNPDEAKVMKNFVADSVRAGATGVGGAEGYMGPESLHIGGGKPAVWGAGGTGSPNSAIGDGYNAGMKDQQSGAGAKEFAEWKDKRDAAAKAGIKLPDSAVSAIDPKSKEASIFNPGNTPSSIKPGMGLGAMAKAMGEAPNASATSGAIGGDGKYPLGTAPKIDSEAAMKKLGIGGGDGTKSEADYTGDAADGVIKSAYTGGGIGSPNTAGKSRGANGILTDQSDWTKSTTIDPVTRNQEIAAAAMRQKGFSTAETQQGMGQIGAETGFMPRSENTHYSAAQLHKLWPAKFPTIDSARSIVRQGDAAIANRIYGNRMGNQGRAGAGYSYRGHGDNQLTGRDAYVKMDKALGLNGALVSNPDMANDPVIAARINAQFLTDKKKQGFDISTAKGATNATGPAGDRQQNIQTRAGIANEFGGKVDDLAAKGQAEISADTKAKMSADDVGNTRIPKPDPESVAATKADTTVDSSLSPRSSSTPGVGTATGGQTKSAPAPAASPAPMTSAMNNSYTPMTHSSLGLVVINSPGLA